MARPALNRWAIRLLNVLLFLAIFVAVGRTLGDPYKWVNDALADKLANLIYGYGKVGGEEIDDVYFYIDFVSVVAIATAIYFVVMKLIRRIGRQ
ncbi:hypothetical protein [Pseudescherichia sp.]|uniref:hypothetical protein n=1 Tax=Pseudescherichia sp. TaxID=2055881 RepID=UPI00289A9CB1|nr:hypothetical protein [Pseudescherichia sp.]